MKTLSAILFATFLTVGTANAAPIQWADNGHWYDVVFLEPLLEWEQARDLAQESGGYLASLTSAEENDFVWHFLNNNLVDDSRYKQYWLGGYQTDTLAEPEGHWAWVSGEDWDYTNWRVGEPNNDIDGTQDYLHYWWTANGEWDDMENGRYMSGYVVEYNQYSFGAGPVPYSFGDDPVPNPFGDDPVPNPFGDDPVPTPEPSTMFLLGCGLIGLAGFGRKLTRP